MQFTRRHTLKFAGISCAATALAGALKAEGGTPAANAATSLPFAVTTPMHIGQAALRVRDLDPMIDYYRSVLGMNEVGRTARGVTLGVGSVPLLDLVHKPAADFESPTSAGLFHIAYLMPSRKDLARWLVHAALRQVPLSGFADHNVSEAVYLNDPEGNGIEVYSDRPKDAWVWSGRVVKMGTEPLDVDNLVALTDTKTDHYEVAPAGMRIGHIHLRVGEIAAARGFYEQAVGLQPTQDARSDASFLSSGGYHHHLAVNSWNSRGAKERNAMETGLDWFSITVRNPDDLEAQKTRLRAAGYVLVEMENDMVEAIDPWGTRLRLVPG
ncbi:VOC family protein [Agrobacterium genomosp. 3 str. CIP 111-78]|uniref:VOC family protein n=1 Tax=Agrobacterium tumefaciens TaxID=358 RepID=A0AAE6EJ71_AGRTU|nr:MULTISPECIES: VOC family protein [Agrobacterium tumefaciens complex]MCA2373410.1 VOC family protein [Agrobacterium tomkonis CIP 111-78]QCL99104.1 VOC family protein [Agrobacterium tumefaciens]